VSPVYVINKGSVIISLFEFISACYMKPLEWTADVEVSDLYHIFGRLGGGRGPNEPNVLRPKILNYGAK